jgi:uncharacterized linocin/CFP29 family protein
VNHLLRELAPITDTGWSLLDEEARQRLQPALAARRLVDFDGPHGYEHSATNLGRVEPLGTAPTEGVHALRRRVLPLIELRAPFELSRVELRSADRGADDTDLTALDEAAHQLAMAENVAVFYGWDDAISGIAGESPHETIKLGKGPEAYPGAVARAVEWMLQSGVSGPYGLALGSDQYRQVIATTEHGGYPVREHLEKIVEGPVVWAPGVSGAVVLSLRGGDFVFDAGQDISIGYDSHDAETVRLYLEETFSFHVATPEAAVPLSG